MFNKLLKYDMTYMFKNMWPLYLVLFATSVCIRVFSILDLQGIFFNGLEGLITFANIVSMILSFGAIVLFSVIRYYKNIYSKEGYLTNSLPVSKTSIILSKYVSTFLMLLINIIFVIIGIQIIGQIDILEIIEFLKTINSEEGLTSLAVYFLILMILLAPVLYVANIFLACTLGRKTSKNKILNSILLYFVINFVIQLISIIIMGIISLLNSDFKQIFTETTVSPDIISSFLIVFICIIIALLIINICLNLFLHKKSFNIE
ncbi:MAG: hypothetical protein ACK5HL_00535 [Bacilli bacterium]